MRLSVVQTNPRFGETSANLLEAISLMEQEESDLYVLPELFNTGYNFIDAAEVNRLAEPSDGESFRAIAEFARKRSCYVAYGFAEKADRLYNSSLLVGPAGSIGLYRKVHLFNKETILFAPGNVGFPLFDLPFGRVGMMICFDWFYPEAARTLALGGARLILHPANLVLPHCPDAMITRCLENRVFAATANRIGTEDRGGNAFTYIGTSEIVSHKGEVVQRLGPHSAGIASAEIDLSAAADKKINPYNDLLANRRTDQYRLL